MDYYRLACTPKYLLGKSPDLNSYQATMLEWGIDKLDDIRNSMPNAGGLVIAPSIEVAEYMTAILEKIDGEKPTVVHNQVKNVESRIDAFRNTTKRWIVSVAMISESISNGSVYLSTCPMLKLNCRLGNQWVVWSGQWVMKTTPAHML